MILYASLKLHGVFPKSGTKSYLSTKEDCRMREGDQYVVRLTGEWSQTACWGVLLWGSLSASGKTYFLLAIGMQWASSLSQTNFSSSMNNKVKYIYSLRWSVLFCDKKKKLQRVFFIFNLKANEYLHIRTDTRKSREEFKYCILKIICCKFLLCVLPFTPLKYEDFKFGNMTTNVTARKLLFKY